MLLGPNLVTIAKTQFYPVKMFFFFFTSPLNYLTNLLHDDFDQKTFIALSRFQFQYDPKLTVKGKLVCLLERKVLS